MDLKLIKNLLDMISESEVNEVSIEEGDFKIKIKKAAEGPSVPTTVFAQPSPMPYPTYEAPQNTSAQQPVAQPVTDQPASSEDNSSNSLTVKSPIVGTFYRSASPDSDPFVKEGDTVAKGDTLCIVEAMKIMNEIDSEYSGKIVKILVDDAQPIEYNQPLFIIEPS